ncbi:hypothetical protein F2Q70_00002260 [Brassica cretica]|uniref:Uncharacterized protein n=1 Tax=Brassica cretica TaxID=69181 RepID=A0A3N6RVU4_BRACR|nr:hypothetical protein F2Q70_00002260 [Brassica cretica]KAF3569308.1 hypothetical protein DY000_02013663 [Brassica cretica]
MLTVEFRRVSPLTPVEGGLLSLLRVSQNAERSSTWWDAWMSSSMGFPPLELMAQGIFKV